MSEKGEGAFPSKSLPLPPDLPLPTLLLQLPGIRTAACSVRPPGPWRVCCLHLHLAFLKAGAALTLRWPAVSWRGRAPKSGRAGGNLRHHVLFREGPCCHTQGSGTRDVRPHRIGAISFPAVWGLGCSELSLVARRWLVVTHTRPTDDRSCASTPSTLALSASWTRWVANGGQHWGWDGGGERAWKLCERGGAMTQARIASRGRRGRVLDLCR